MRELLLASGGRCAMTDCGLSLIAPSGAWVGTVAHIIAAEPDGPRGDATVDPKDRRSFENLVLMCATHGREVDDVDVGERDFSVDQLRIMKAQHEGRISEAVGAAISDEQTGKLQRASAALDIGVRVSSGGGNAIGLAESLRFDATMAVALVLELGAARESLVRLSQPALDTLAGLVGLWRLSQADSYETKTYYFGDPTGSGVSLNAKVVGNRITKGYQAQFYQTTQELVSRQLLRLPDREDEYQTTYDLLSPWHLVEGRGRNKSYYEFWIAVAEFLWQAHGVLVDDWLKVLDFSIFDRPASAQRVVSWRD